MLIPSHPTREEVAEKEIEFLNAAAKQRDEQQLLFNTGDKFRGVPALSLSVPEPSPRGIPVGRTLDLNKLEPRRQPKQHIKETDN